MFDDLNNDNFLIFAVKSYNTQNCTLSELTHDLKRFKYLKRLFRKYKSSGQMKERLVLNHIIILTNIFGPNVIRMLFFKIDQRDYDILKTFLIFLNLMPKIVHGISGYYIVTTS